MILDSSGRSPRLPGGSYRLLFAFLAALSAIGACQSGNSNDSTKFVATGAKIPDPCKLITPRLANDLVGTMETKGTTTLDGKKVKTPECTWRNDDGRDSDKQGLISLNVMTFTERIKSHSPFQESMADYRTAVGKNNCNRPKVSVPDACWYTAPDEGLRVVVRKDYTVVSVLASGTNSPGLERAEHGRTADRIANDIVKGLT